MAFIVGGNNDAAPWDAVESRAIAGPIALLRYFKTLNIYIENHVTPGTGILKDLTALFDLVAIN